MLVQPLKIFLLVDEDSPPPPDHTSSEVVLVGVDKPAQRSRAWIGVVFVEVRDGDKSSDSVASI